MTPRKPLATSLLTWMNPACPELPHVTQQLRAAWPRQWRDQDPMRYYHACLEAAQSLWQQGLPAQAILQLNKALTIKVAPPERLPYPALVWMLAFPNPSGFLGNPVRHFQHLASRLPQREPHDQLRQARAWACFHLAKELLDATAFPPDEQQIQREALQIPDFASCSRFIEDHSTWQGEAMELGRLWHQLTQT